MPHNSRRAICLVVLAFMASARPAGQTADVPTILPLFDRYQKGDFDAPAHLAATLTPEQVRASFIAAADAWIVRDASDIINRRLVATAFAIEMAHARLSYDNANLMVLLVGRKGSGTRVRPAPASACGPAPRLRSSDAAVA